MKPISRSFTDEEVVSLEPGIYLGIPFEQYLTIDAFSKSGVKDMMRSPMHYKYYKDNPKETDAMALGSLVDCMLLEPELFNSQYIMQPDTFPSPVKVKKNETPRTEQKPWTNRSSVCREYAKTLVLRTGKMIISPDMLKEAEAIIANIKKSITASDYLVGMKQVTLVWYDEETGVKCKARPDNLDSEFSFITDLKTTDDASETSWRHTMTKFDYHVQAAMYMDGFRVLSGEDTKLPFVFVVGETSAPYGVAIYHARTESIITGRKRYREALRLYKYAKENDLWEQSYIDDVVDVDVLPYALDRNLSDEDYD